MIAEYIDREKAIEIIKSGGYWEREDMEVAIACIEQTPTADVVDVVRCKDCRLATEDIMIGGWYHCSNNGMMHKPDVFCSYGERKEEE